MDKITQIRNLPSFGGAKHTVVLFENGSAACSCGVGFSKPTILTPPNLRNDNEC